MIPLLSCPLTKSPCRHAGLNYNIVSEPVYKKYGGIPVEVSRVTKILPDERGIYCNNDGNHYVSEIKVCPAIPTITGNILSIIPKRETRQATL